jgi:hypothetical protein
MDKESPGKSNDAPPVESRESISFDTIADVLDYLVDSGWKVTKTSLYRHQKEGKIQPCPNGTYLQKDVDKYAKAFLRQKSTGRRISERRDELQRRKLELEIETIEIDKKRKLLAYNKDQGQLVPREQMEIELAMRAGVLDAGLKHWVQSNAAAWIRAVSGDMKKVGEFINLMSRDLDEHINRYAASSEFQVVIDADEESEMDVAAAAPVESEEVKC